MMMNKKIRAYVGPALIITVMLIFPQVTYPHKYMDLKSAIKYFLPNGSSVFKVTKNIPAEKMDNVRKRFFLKDTADFKETLSPGPYTVYLGKDAQGKVTSYIIILEQYWRTCYHKYAVGLDAAGKIKEVIVVKLNCRYAYPINSERFLKQFKDKKARKGATVPAILGKDIDAVTGATASSDATAIVARRALALFEVFFSE